MPAREAIREVKSGIICVECSASTPVGEAEGSLKHPYCKPCFKKVWDNNYDRYMEWLARTHG